MYDYLVDHARKNAWCSPRQDLQVILKPQRLSPSTGVHTSTPHLWGSIPLPTPRDRYHLYQIGQIHPSLLGLLPVRRVWHTLAHVMEQGNLIADLYTNHGLHLARFESWILVTEERNVLLAVKEQRRIADLRTEPVYLRLYSNSFFSSDRADGQVHQIVCKGQRFVDLNQALLFQNEYHLEQAKPGMTQLYINGVYVHDFLPQSLSAGDIMEFVRDTTVKAIIDFPIQDLPTFASIKDAKSKYLLHYAGPQVGGEIIDYRDDIDAFLIEKGELPNGRVVWNGLYVHKNQDDTLRMVTHRDYSISVPYLLAYLESRPQWTNIHNLTVRLVIRQAGYARPLINEHHRIKELYKLSEHDRVMALTGTDSSVDVWKAVNLENSFYPEIMDAQWNAIDNQLVQDAYGYNAISKLVADSPQYVEMVSGRRQITVPHGLYYNSTMFEYDAAGKLLGFYFHTAGAEYVPYHSQTVLIEGLVGRGGYKISTVFGQQDTPINPDMNYRFYIAPRAPGGEVQHHLWRDVTGDPDEYMIVNGAAHWFADLDSYAVAVKSDMDFLAYDLSLTSNNGLLKFSIDSEATYPNGSAQGIMHIPVGKLDLWLNGHALIEGLDYFVKWPQVVITNKTYLVPGPTQNLTVRGTGFCNSDMSREPAKDVGFVEYGLMSRNNRFDIRDDKVQRIVVRGSTKHRDMLLFSESDDGLYMDNIPNGSPYVIEDVIVPLRGLTNEDTYSLRSKSLVVDQAVSDYLTLKLPEPVRPVPDMIEDKYAIYSPFASTVMYDLINGVLEMDDFKGQYSNADVMDFLADYEYLLEYDPTQKDVNLNYVSIHPHNLLTETVLDIYQYNFLARAIKVFLEDRVDITRFISIKPNYI